MAAVVDLAVDAGATFRHTLSFLNRPELPSPPTPRDFSGCSARMDIRAKASDAVPLLTLDTTGGGLKLPGGGARGVVELYMSPAETDALGWTGTAFRASAVYDLEIEYPSGDVERPIGGTLTITPSVTRSS